MRNTYVNFLVKIPICCCSDTDKILQGITFTCRTLNWNDVKSDKSHTLTLLCVDRSKSVVAHLVHKAVEKYRRSLLVNTELPLRSVVISFLDVSTTICTASNTYHPQELVYICNSRTMWQQSCNHLQMCSVNTLVLNFNRMTKRILIHTWP